MAVKDARERAGMKQPETAAAAHISRGYIGQIESGIVRPSPEVLRRIAVVVGADYTSLAIHGNYSDKPKDYDPDDAWFASLPKDLKRRVRQMAGAAIEALKDYYSEQPTTSDTDADANGEPDGRGDDCNPPDTATGAGMT